MPRRARRIAAALTILTALSACAPAGQPQAQATARASTSPLVVERPTPSPTPSPAPTPTPAPVVAPTLPPGVVLIGMRVFPQVMNLDCETAALQMGLDALGHYYTQQQLFAPQNPDNTLPVLDPNNRHRVLQWGNPYERFVGKVDGSDLGPTGYGVYWPPILAIAQSHGAPNSIGREGFTAPDIYQALADHHPVLVWVETGWENARAAGYTGVWTAWDGHTRISYSLIEHVVTLSGVSPTQVRVNDPWRAGSQYWYSKAAFEYSWRDFNDMAVILR